MIVVTGANHLFKKTIKYCIRSVEKLGYEILVYDLGNLNYGKNFFIDDYFFQNYGYYSKIATSYFSTCLHKPKIILDALESTQKNILYIDSDAFIISKLDYVFDFEFDIAVTLRRTSEIDKEPFEDHKKIMGKINAGIIFLKNNMNTTKFVHKWISLTEKLKNDQLALNILLTGIQINEVMNINEIKVLGLKTDEYNFYYFNEPINPSVKILHYKNGQHKYYSKHNLVI